MYLEYFDLKEKPFSLTPDPRFLFLSESHRQALDHMVYGIQEREGFILIIGDIGTGKTTICRELLEKVDSSVSSALILNPMLSEQELLEAILQDFGIGTGSDPSPANGETATQELFERLDEDTQAALDLNPMMPGAKVLDNILKRVERPSGGSTKKELIDRLNDFLLNSVAEGGNAVLIIDEAQNLSPQVLEQIRILSNLETPKQKLLQIVLVGQLELKRKLEQSNLRQLNQRISVRYQLRPLSFEDTKRYILHRLFVAGSNSSVVFSDTAHEAIYEYSRGVPRLINMICERCILGAYVDQVKRIDPDLVKRCKSSLESNLEIDDAVECGRPEYAVVKDAGDGQVKENYSLSEADDSLRQAEEYRDTPKEAVVQPWERKIRQDGGRLWKKITGRWSLRGGVGLLSVLLIFWALFSIFGGGKAPLDNKSAGGVKVTETAAPGTINSVRLNYSIQLSTFPNMEDCLEQQSRMTELGLKNGTYVVLLHQVKLSGRWYRLLYGSFPSKEDANRELSSLASRGLVKADIARIVETPLAFNLGDYVGLKAAEQKCSQYMNRLRIPCYPLPLERKNNAVVYRLYAGAFEKKDEASFLGDRLEASGLRNDLVERLGLWPQP
jgi:type II secretory pathway predicted ATPase ExeA